MKKYEFTGETKTVFGVTLHKIRALKDFSNVEKGDLGGWIEKESNLSHEGSAWVYEDATVYDNARVYGDTMVYGNAMVFGNARVFGDAKVETSKDVVWFSNVGSENGTLTAFKTKKVFQ